MVNGRGDTPNRHDILTGSQLDGTAFPAGTDKTCGNWTSSGEGSAQVGHHDRQGGGENQSRNSARLERLQPGEPEAARWLFYCFLAANRENGFTRGTKK
jgi:hypothetical protein